MPSISYSSLFPFAIGGLVVLFSAVGSVLILFMWVLLDPALDAAVKASIFQIGESALILYMQVRDQIGGRGFWLAVTVAVLFIVLSFFIKSKLEDSQIRLQEARRSSLTQDTLEILSTVVPALFSVLSDVLSILMNSKSDDSQSRVQEARKLLGDTSKTNESGKFVAPSLPQDTLGNQSKVAALFNVLPFFNKSNSEDSQSRVQEARKLPGDTSKTNEFGKSVAASFLTQDILGNQSKVAALFNIRSFFIKSKSEDSQSRVQVARKLPGNTSKTNESWKSVSTSLTQNTLGNQSTVAALFNVRSFFIKSKSEDSQSRGQVARKLPGNTSKTNESWKSVATSLTHNTLGNQSTVAALFNVLPFFIKSNSEDSQSRVQEARKLRFKKVQRRQFDPIIGQAVNYHLQHSS